MQWQEIAQTVLSGALTGSASSITAVLAIFRDLKHKLAAFEERLGIPSTGLAKATGLHLKIEEVGDKCRSLQETLGKQQKAIEDWEENPPDWVFRTRNRASVNMEVQQEFENRIEGRFRNLQERVSRSIDDVETIRRRLDERYVMIDDYEKDSKKRSEDIAQLRENLASANGLLKGMLMAVGVIDEPTTGKVPRPR